MHNDLIQAACPFVRSLAAAGNHTVQLAVFDEGYAVYVDQVYGPHPLTSISLGSRAPASVVSTGKVLLAWLPDSAAEQSHKLLRQFTQITVLKKSEIETELDLVRSRGYAINTGEFREDTGGFAAGIFGGEGTILGSIGFCVHVYSGLSEAEKESLSGMVVKAASSISLALGFDGTPRRL